MRAFIPAFGVMLLAFGGLWYVGGGSKVPQSVAAAERSYISDPLTHNNLTVFFVHGPDSVADTHKVATLQEALEAGWAVVHETGNVNELAVENRSDDTELFIQEGDIIKGGQQDRTFATDMLVPPKSGVVPFPAHCVEQGRWSGRGAESATQFNKSDQRIVGSKLQYANATRQQGEVWGSVKENQDKLTKKLNTKVNAAESETSFQLTLENKDLQTKVAEFEKALRSAGESGKNVVGVVFLVNGKVAGAEVYGSNTLFKKAWPKLLRSQATEAVAETTDKPLPPMMTVLEVEQFLALASQPDTKAVAAPNEESNIRGHGQAQTVYTGRTGQATGLNNRAYQDLQRQAVVDPSVAELNMDNNTATIGGIEPQRLREIAGADLTPEQRAQRIQELTRNLSPEHRRLVENYFTALAQPAQQNRLARNVREATPRALANQPLNQDGNRLNVNRVENGTGLVSESRDPARQNAVIHKSYIKK